jgi:hypothetical protein
MNFRRRKDNGEIVIENYKTPSSKPTTLPNKRNKPRRAERRKLRRLSVKMGGYNSISASNQPAYTKPGVMR